MPEKGAIPQQAFRSRAAPPTGRSAWQMVDAGTGTALWRAPDRERF